MRGENELRLVKVKAKLYENLQSVLEEIKKLEPLRKLGANFVIINSITTWFVIIYNIMSCLKSEYGNSSAEVILLVTINAIVLLTLFCMQKSVLNKIKMKNPNLDINCIENFYTVGVAVYILVYSLFVIIYREKILIFAWLMFACLSSSYIFLLKSSVVNSCKNKVYPLLLNNIPEIKYSSLDDVILDDIFTDSKIIKDNCYFDIETDDSFSGTVSGIPYSVQEAKVSLISKNNDETLFYGAVLWFYMPTHLNLPNILIRTGKRFTYGNFWMNTLLAALVAFGLFYIALGIGSVIGLMLELSHSAVFILILILFLIFLVFEIIWFLLYTYRKYQKYSPNYEIFLNNKKAKFRVENETNADIETIYGIELFHMLQDAKKLFNAEEAIFSVQNRVIYFAIDAGHNLFESGGVFTLWKQTINQTNKIIMQLCVLLSVVSYFGKEEGENNIEH